MYYILTSSKKQFDNNCFNQIWNNKTGLFVMPLLDCGLDKG